MRESLKSSPARIITLLDSAEAGLIRYTTPLAAAIITVGLVFRVYYASACYLNPDEAYHLGLARADSIRAVYLKFFTQPHPPLLTLILYFLVKLGSSELLLRMPSLIASTLGSWLGFRWGYRVFGAGPAIGMLAMLTFSPAMTSTAIEVRHYGLLVLGICGAIYGLERAFDEHSWKWMAFGYALLYLAILSHYSALWIVVTVSFYGVLRLYQLHFSPRLVMAWTGFQAVVVLLYVVLYFGHAVIMRSRWYDYAVNGYLNDGYFHGGQQTVFDFLSSGFINVFSYLSGLRLAGYLGLVLFVIGLITLLVIPPKQGGKTRGDLSFLMGFPLFLGCLGAVLHILPFIGTRHMTYILLFLAAGISFPVFRWVKYKAVFAFLLCLFGPAWLVMSMASPGMKPNNRPDVLPRQEMVSALEFLAAEVRDDSPLLVDKQTFLELEHYLGGSGPIRKSAKFWAFNRQNFKTFVYKAGTSLGIEPGETVWVMSARWFNRRPLTEMLPEQSIVKAGQFGQISLVQIRMPESRGPEKALAE